MNTYSSVTTQPNIIDTCESISRLLSERLRVHDDSRRVAQGKLHEICNGLRSRIDEIENVLGRELAAKFTAEDNRLQAALDGLRTSMSTDVTYNIARSIQKAREELLVMQSYNVVGCDLGNEQNMKVDFNSLCKLETNVDIVPEILEMTKPEDLRVVDIVKKEIFIQFGYFKLTRVEMIPNSKSINPVAFKCLVTKKNGFKVDEVGKIYDLEPSGDSLVFTPNNFEAGAAYGIRVKVTIGDKESSWSDEVCFVTPHSSESISWKECPDYVYEQMRYSVDSLNPLIATSNPDTKGRHTIVGNSSLPFGNVLSWSIRILNTRGDNGNGVYVGVAPFYINQNRHDNYDNCGWYFSCYHSALQSGSPHNYKYPGKEYGPRKENGKYVHNGDYVGVVMDTAKGDLSFVLNGVNLGVAFERIPLDDPLVPCVILEQPGVSVELVLSELQETALDSSIPVPSNFTVRGITWDSITLTWDPVERASFYQVEMDGSKSWDSTPTNKFEKTRLPPDTEHTFRVRAVRENAMGEWSVAVKLRTEKRQDFYNIIWKLCPGSVERIRQYYVNENNARIATKSGGLDSFSTIIGNTIIPSGTITSWYIKVLKSRANNGEGIYVGVAPFDINQDESFNYVKNGWYFHCYDSTLYSGPPHSFNNKLYGQRKENGKYVRDGGSVGVIMDTESGDLSFALKRVNLGVEYHRIPLDKPLVPCVILGFEGSSVEFILPDSDDSCVIS